MFDRNWDMGGESGVREKIIRYDGCCILDKKMAEKFIHGMREGWDFINANSSFYFSHWCECNEVRTDDEHKRKFVLGSHCNESLTVIIELDG
jgi:hypothetical protein